jgi:hypothetical protein
MLLWLELSDMPEGTLRAILQQADISPDKFLQS